MNIFATRIKALQKLMKQNKLDAYIVSSNDIHFNEYLPDCFKDRVFMSGFTGSAGILVVLENSAHLFTDGRYWIQAKKELENSDIILEKQDKNHNFISFLAQKLKKNSTIGTNPKTLSINEEENLINTIKDSKFNFIDLIDLIYKDRPKLPNNAIFKQKFYDKDINQKLKLIRSKMLEKNTSYHLVSSLDDIAYITNLRGNDINYNPVFLSFLLINHEEAMLFVNDNSLEKRLKIKDIKIIPYQKLESILNTIKNQNILIDYQKTSVYIKNILEKNNNKIINDTNPSTLLKIYKSNTELNYINKAMIADGVALCEFFCFFEKELNKNKVFDELEIDSLLSNFRAKNKFYISNSFSTIVAFNEHSALPHFTANENNFSYIKKDGLLLIDSGAQYQNGTTDITRVLPIGKINKAQKKDYTLVLKALISLSTAIFPEGIMLNLIDSIARVNLWKNELDYMHGTGHGVGYFLNVHEAPINISYLSALNPKNIAKEGIVSSIEPGIYKEGKYGIRLENLVQICKHKENEFGKFLKFKTLTLCPFECKLIDFSLLTLEEKKWLNAYHKRVFNSLALHLQNNTLKWLKKKIKIFLTL